VVGWRGAGRGIHREALANQQVFAAASIVLAERKGTAEFFVPPTLFFKSRYNDV